MVVDWIESWINIVQQFCNYKIKIEPTMTRIVVADFFGRQ